MMISHSNDNNTNIPKSFLIYPPDGIPQVIHSLYQIMILTFIAFIALPVQFFVCLKFISSKNM